MLGLGLRQLSMSPRGIPGVKDVVRALDLGAAEALGRRCIAAATAQEVEELLGAFGAASLQRGSRARAG